MDKTLISISVRDLIEFVMKKGSIDDRYVSRTRAVEGTHAHQKLQKSNLEIYKNYEKEVHLKLDFSGMGFQIIVEGRADGIIIENNKVMIEEIKSTTRELIHIDEEYNELHWAQVMFYGYIYMVNNDLKEITLLLSYFQLESEDVKSFERNYSFHDALLYVKDVLEKYQKFINMREEYLESRNESIHKLKFPFEKYRKGQRELAVAWYNTIKEKDTIFIQAPTGIGKTISTIFPAIKALGNGFGERIFYLTAKTITRTVAEEGIEKLKNKNLYINSITLTAKEKACLNDKVSCNPEECKYARGYFDKINDIIYEVLKKNNMFSREIIENIAKKYEICPFELSLDLSLWCDVIICDYNYAFDNRAKLIRFFEEGLQENLLLVDEAHNLVDRAREMYSAEVYKSKILELSKKLKGKSRRLYGHLNSINKILIQIRHESEERGENRFYIKEQYKELYKGVRAFIVSCDEYLVNSKSSAEYDEVLELYFDLRKFISAAELYKQDKYVTVVECSGSEVRVKIFCIDPSDNIGKIINGAYSSVIFSATLSPMNYYIDLIGGTEESYRLTLPSPFNAENLNVKIEPINMRYFYREQNIPKVNEKINQLINEKVGNYMVFAPSYDYMKKIYSRYIEEYGNDNVIIQGESLSEEERDTFLGNFKEGNNIIAFCVMGGLFSEGVDLPGDRLIGVVVIGVGFPMINFERDIIKECFDNRGFDYAYVFPGVNKIMQAAGRVIRTEEDKGTVLLIDDRYLSKKYKELLPKEW